jgi:hypothetical protein
MSAAFTAKRLSAREYEYRGVRILWKKEYRSKVVTGYSLPAEYRFTVAGVNYSPRTLADAKVIIDGLNAVAA